MLRFVSIHSSYISHLYINNSCHRLQFTVTTTWSTFCLSSVRLFNYWFNIWSNLVSAHLQKSMSWRKNNPGGERNSPSSFHCVWRAHPLPASAQTGPFCIPCLPEYWSQNLLRSSPGPQWSNQNPEKYNIHTSHEWLIFRMTAQCVLWNLMTWSRAQLYPLSDNGISFTLSTLSFTRLHFKFSRSRGLHTCTYIHKQWKLGELLGWRLYLWSVVWDGMLPVIDERRVAVLQCRGLPVVCHWGLSIV